jgi:uncharacterized protein HemX
MPEALSKLLDQGVLAILLVLAIGAIITLYKDNQELNKSIKDAIKEETDKRLQDMKDNRDTIIEPLKVIQRSSERTIDLLESVLDGRKV